MKSVWVNAIDSCECECFATLRHFESWWPWELLLLKFFIIIIIIIKSLGPIRATGKLNHYVHLIVLLQLTRTLLFFRYRLDWNTKLNCIMCTFLLYQYLKNDKIDLINLMSSWDSHNNCFSLSDCFAQPPQTSQRSVGSCSILLILKQSWQIANGFCFVSFLCMEANCDELS